LVGAGMKRAEAVGLATTLVALLEGAHVLCRAEGSIEPFDRMTRSLARLVDGGTGARRRTATT
jgi:hypothetical protein